MSEDILKDSWVPEGPISKTIKDRLKKAGKRFHSNDNISEYIEDGEMDQEDLKKIQQDVAAADALTGGVDAKAGALSRDGTKMVASAKNKLYQQVAKRINNIAKELS